MKPKKLDFLIYPNAVLAGWAVLFLLCSFFPGLGNVTALLALGHIAFLFLNIPLAFVSLILNAKDLFSQKFSKPIIILSFVNIFISILDWVFILVWIKK